MTAFSQGVKKVDRKILRGGKVVTMEPSRSLVETADILIEDGKIAAIEPGIDRPDAEIIDIDGMIAFPGFVDTHRHIWQTAIRGVAANWTLVDYVKHIRLGYATVYHPEDVYLSNLVGALEAIDSGITTVCDFSHIMNSPEHADAALEGLVQSGIRALFCYGFYEVPLKNRYFASHQDRIRDAERILKSELYNRQRLVTMNVALTEQGLVDDETTKKEVLFARHNGLRMTAHVGTIGSPHGIRKLYDQGLMGPDFLFVHCNRSTDEELRIVADYGSAVSVTPETELQMGMGFPVTGRLLRLGMKPSIGIDIVSDCSGDMFTQMRLALQVERALQNEKLIRENQVPTKIPLTVLDALRFATVNGAAAVGMMSEIGTLAPGKHADIAVLNTDRINFMPEADPVEAIVLQARPENIDTVLIGGQIRKRHGKLTGVDLAALREAIRRSKERIRGLVETADRELTAEYVKVLENHAYGSILKRIESQSNSDHRH